MKKFLTVLLVLAVAASAFAGGGGEPETGSGEAAAAAPAAPTIKNPDTLVYATYGTVDTLDVAKSYDTASSANIYQIYEPLIDFKGTATDEFVPVLATEVPTVANGGILEGGKVYRFKIRDGVKFHSGNTLTPEDVEYTFERNMVLDPDGGPCWIWTFLFLDEWSTRDGDGNIAASWEDIDNAIEVDGDEVVFTLAKPFPPFMGVIANVWAVIVDKDFVIENGGWDGTEATWMAANNPDEDTETLWDVASGTGPYKLDRWDKGVELVVSRFEDYWGEKPDLQKGIYKVVEEWSTRKLMLLQGDADIAQVDALYYPEMDKESGLTIYKELPSLTVGGIGFNQAIVDQDNPNIHSAMLDGAGIPADFFTDKDVRLGFIYAWDEEVFIRDIMNGTAMDPVSPVVTGLPFKDDSIERLPHDLAKAEEHFKKAFGGDVWEKGFEIDLLYNTGNDVRQSGNRMLAENVMKINPKFKINVRGVEWSEYVDNVRKRTMPIFFIGWAPDYPDPDNYVQPYMHSEGHYAHRCSYSNPYVDELVEAAAISLDNNERQKMYSELQQIWVDDAVGIMSHQALDQRYMKDWVKGHYFNPMFSNAYYKLREYSKE